MVKLIRKLLYPLRLRRAIRLADAMTSITGRRYLVLMHLGRPKVYEQRQLKNAIKRKCFTADFDIRRARQIALYVSQPHLMNQAYKQSAQKPAPSNQIPV